MAGLTPQDAAPILSEVIREALVDLSDTEYDLDVQPDLVDVNLLEPVAFTALRNNLQAEKLELERALRRGEVLRVKEAAAAWGDRCAVAKTIIMSLLGDPSLNFEGCTEAEALELLACAVERAVEPLGLEDGQAPCSHPRG